MALLAEDRQPHRPLALTIAAAVAIALLIAVVGPPQVGPAGAEGSGTTGASLASRSISSGSNHVCAIDDDGDVRCWGDDDNGQLGYGDGIRRGDDPGEMGDDLLAIDLGTGRTATAITTAMSHSCAILDDGSVKCWGGNAGGQLGYGDSVTRGDDPGEMGDDLPTVDLGSGRTASAISAGTFHSCAILDDGSVKCWGWAVSGQLGHGDTVARGNDPGEMGDDLPTVDLGAGRTATTIDAGTYHSCAILDDGSAKCWGTNDFGQLGYGDTVTRGDGPGEMGDDLPAIDLGAGRTATAIDADEMFTCATLDDGSVKCWGNNSGGQLGQGDTAGRGDDPGEMGDDLPAIDLGAGRTATAVSIGIQLSCALLDDGTLKCWGRNDYGALGQGEISRRGDGPGEMGDDLPAVDIPIMTRAVAPPPTPTPTPDPDDEPDVTAEPAPTCMGSEATIVGRPNQRVIVGTDGDDVIVTRNPARVTIIGGDGNDLICGTRGADTLRGGPGNDLIFGRGGDDYLGGGQGDDRLRGGSGDDELHGRAGDDRLDGGDDTDTCHGGYGRDRDRNCETITTIP